MESAAFLCLGIGAWLAATFLPFLIALWFWDVAARLSSAWAAHILFAPCRALVEWALTWAILFAAHDDGSGPPGLGLLLLLPGLVNLMALVG